MLSSSGGSVGSSKPGVQIQRGHSPRPEQVGSDVLSSETAEL